MYNVSMKILLQQGLLKPEFYGDLLYKLRSLLSTSDFSEQFVKVINHCKRLSITVKGYKSL